MPHDTQANRSPKTAIHAMVAVVLALVVSAAAPLTGDSSERSLAGIRLVQCTEGSTLAACSADWLHVRGLDAASMHRAAPASAVQLVRAAERAQWRTALPPPAAA